ncbi:hypothetical protein Thal_0586 [Thermocrinis albus DSM 14484]|uniref:Uncharacterized protein n=1 Tax=Thermocrinis albus (strain DSM 14484 / JCM 11386 / HI 11/12) TaxID=638303 RepID=D3SPY3_THEAH|nr:hypothetical protein [Thermocrinis albus]ADC89220.1 hypothetical protein Thal_0586 [Thermocrinis albus DSM 14484]
MKYPYAEFIRYIEWRDRYLKECEELPPFQDRFLRALECMYVGGVKQRTEDPEVKHWADWAALKTYRHFNGFPHLSDKELMFVFYVLGKLLIPLLLHEKGVKSESFKALSLQDQEKAVEDVLDTIWEQNIIRLLQILPQMDLNSTTK